MSFDPRSISSRFASRLDEPFFAMYTSAFVVQRGCPGSLGVKVPGCIAQKRHPPQAPTARLYRLLGRGLFGGGSGGSRFSHVYEQAAQK